LTVNQGGVNDANVAERHSVPNANCYLPVANIVDFLEGKIENYGKEQI